MSRSLILEIVWILACTYLIATVIGSLTTIITTKIMSPHKRR